LRGLADLATGAENALPAVPREAREPEGSPVSSQKGYTGTCISGHSVIDSSTYGGTMHFTPRKLTESTWNDWRREAGREAGREAERGAGSGREVSQASRREKRTSASNPGSSIKLGHQSRPRPTLRMTTLRDRHD
jgi:hypothetical protein